jgi:hypothetical protein
VRVEVGSRPAPARIELLRINVVIVDQVLLDLVLVGEPQLALGALMDTHGNHPVSLRPPA